MLLFAYRRAHSPRGVHECVCVYDVCINHKACPLPIQTQLSMHMQQQRVSVYEWASKKHAKEIALKNLIKKFVASLHCSMWLVMCVCVCVGVFVCIDNCQWHPQQQSGRPTGIVLIDMGPMPCETCYKSFTSQTERGLNSILQLTA